MTSPRSTSGGLTPACGGATGVVDGVVRYVEIVELDDDVLVDLPAVKSDDVREPLDRPHPRAGDQLRLVLVAVRDDDVRAARVDRGENRRQHAAHRAYASVEPELADVDVPVDRRCRRCARRGQERRGDREVEAGAGLGERSGRQVHGDSLLWQRKAGVGRRGADPVAGLLERGVGQADEAEGR